MVRRLGAALSGLLLSLALLGGAPVAADPARTHGLSTFGELKYPADFKHFEYVNPQAPKGGKISTNGGSRYDSFNLFIVKGDAAQGLGMLYDSLMTRAWDEPDALYGLVAHSVELAADRGSITFHMRPEAKFADGTAVTAEDVAFTLETLKEKGHPGISLQLKEVEKVEVLGPHTVRYRFAGARTRDLPLVVARMPILPKAYYATRPFDQTTLEPPLGSGPYAISSFEQGKFVAYKRREDYWARDLPVNVGRNNFDEVRYEYYQDRGIELQALKAGQIDLREEFTARDWSTAYDIPAVREGKLVREVLPDASPSGAQGFFVNMRLEKFKDVRVRRALDLAFDFEWMNKNIFYGLYKRTSSFFENSDMKAEGPPSAAELALLEPYRAKLMPEVFAAPYVPPASDGSGANRDNLRAAAKLLEEAGWTIKDGRRVNAKGEVLAIEFLFEQPTFLRVSGPFADNLKKLGIDATSRQIDAAQYERRTKSYEFDIIMQRYVMSLTPGIELKNYWSAEAADLPGSRNLAGIKSPVVDALINKVTEAKSRAELVTAARALDRVMRAEHVWVPNWYKATHTVAYWNKFSRPAVKPLYDRGFVDTWWHDAAKAAKLAAN